MNRKQRRDPLKAKPKNKPQNNVASINATNAQSVLDNLPVAQLVAGINNLLKQIEARGISISDWDHKARQLYKLQMIRGQLYFLAAELEDEKQQ